MTVQRVAIAVGAISASVVLALGLTAAGFAPGPASPVAGQVTLGDTELQAPDPTVRPRKVYVKPAPKAQTIIVREAAPSRVQTAQVKKSAPRPKSAAPKAKKRRTAPAPKATPRPTRNGREEGGGREDESAKHECERAAEELKEEDERAAEELKKECERL